MSFPLNWRKWPRANWTNVYKSFISQQESEDGTYYNKKSLTAIRAATDRHLRSSPISKPFCIIEVQSFRSRTRLSTVLLKPWTKRAKLPQKFTKGRSQRKLSRACTKPASWWMSTLSSNNNYSKQLGLWYPCSLARGDERTRQPWRSICL